MTVVPSPARPWKRIEARAGLGSLLASASELWEFRDLLLALAQRDVRLRYKQTALGVVWVVLQPLIASLLFAVVFGRVAGLPSDGSPYLLFVFAGMLPWGFVAAAMQRGGQSLIADARLVSKVYFPRLLVPLASVVSVLVDFTVTFLVMLLLLAAHAMPPGAQALLLPVWMGLMFALAASVAVGLSALTVYFRDFVHMLPFLTQLWMFVSPLVYSVALIDDRWAHGYALNPLVGLIGAFRWSLLPGQAFPTLALLIGTAMTLLLVAMSVLLFQRVERAFADVI